VAISPADPRTRTRRDISAGFVAAARGQRARRGRNATAPRSASRRGGAQYL